MKRLLSEAVIRESRSILEANFHHECDIQANVAVTNAGGGRIPNWQSAAALTPCQMSQLAPAADIVRNDQNRSVVSWRVRFAAGTAVTPANRLVVSGIHAGVAFTRKLMVVSVNATETAVIANARDCTAAELP